MKTEKDLRIAMDKAAAIIEVFNRHFDADAKNKFVADALADDDDKLAMSPEKVWSTDPYNAYERAVAHTQSDQAFANAIEEFRPDYVGDDTEETSEFIPN